MFFFYKFKNQQFKLKTQQSNWKDFIANECNYSKIY